MKKALLIAGGTPPTEELLRESLEGGYDYIAAADGGANALFESDVIPNVVFGDMDSIENEAREFYSKRCEMIKYPVKKDDTDLRLCLSYLIKHGAKEILILGALGRRTDHTLGNLMCLKASLRKKVKIVLKNETETISLHSKPFILYDQKGKTISFFAFFKKVRGLCLKGFEYPLREYDLELGDMLCISNKISAKRAQVTFKSGELLMILEK